MKSSSPFLWIMLTCSFLQSCSQFDNQRPSVYKIQGKNNSIRRNVLEHPEIFGEEVSIFDSYEEMEYLLDCFGDMCNSSQAIELCEKYQIHTDNIRKYIDYCLLMEEVFSEDFDETIDRLHSESDEAEMYAKNLLERAFTNQNCVSIIRCNEALLVEPAVELDMQIFANNQNLLVCGAEVICFGDENVHIIPVEKYIKEFNSIQDVINMKTENTESSSQKECIRRLCRISEPTKDEKGNSYKIKAVFKTHYCYKHEMDDVDRIELANYVWVKNYKKIKRCYVLKKMQNSGFVKFRLGWLKNEPEKDAWGEYRINTQEKHAQHKYKFQNIVAFYGIPIPFVYSRDYYIELLEMDISNDAPNHLYDYFFYVHE